MNRFVQILLLVSLLWTGALTLAQPDPNVITPANADQMTPAIMIGRGALHDMAWSMDGSTLAVATTLGVWLYDSAHLDAEPIYVQSPAMWVNSVAYSPDGTLLAFDAGTNTVGLCHPYTGEGVTFLEIQPGPGLLNWVEWADPDTLTVYDSQWAAYTVDLYTGEAEPAPDSPLPFRPQTLQIGSVTDVYAKGWLDGQSSTITVMGPQDMTFLEGFHSGIGALAFSPDGSDLAFGASDGLVWWWDLDTMQYRLSTPRYSGSQGNGAVNDIAYSPDGTVVASAANQYHFWEMPTASTALRLWDVETAALLQTFNDPADSLSAVAFSPDGNWIAAAGGSGNFTVRRWDLDDDSETDPLIMEGHEGMVRALVYTDLPGLYSASDDGTVRLWDGAGIERAVVEGNGQPVYDLAIDPDRTHLAIAQGHQVHLREIASGTPIRTYETPDNYVRTLNSVAFSPDGVLLAAGGTEHRILLWEVDTGDLLATLDAPSAHDVQDLAFSPDGTLLASAALDGAIWLWRVP